MGHFHYTLKLQLAFLQVSLADDVGPTYHSLRDQSKFFVSKKGFCK